jgi:hypothetical protein
MNQFSHEAILAPRLAALSVARPLTVGMNVVSGFFFEDPTLGLLWITAGHCLEEVQKAAVAQDVTSPKWHYLQNGKYINAPMRLSEHACFVCHKPDQGVDIGILRLPPGVAESIRKRPEHSAFDPESIPSSDAQADTQVSAPFIAGFPMKRSRREPIENGGDTIGFDIECQLMFIPVAEGEVGLWLYADPMERPDHPLSFPIHGLSGAPLCTLEMTEDDEVASLLGVVSGTYPRYGKTIATIAEDWLPLLLEEFRERMD